ncbi:MAG: hypothetical protein IAE90_00860 [Ignavibacteria bacterium]|nr:hypothetical protein [Ignavibacteria bacterium]
MKDTKLITLLRTFSKTEAGRLKEYVKSSYYNKNKHVTQLCNVILGYHPNFDSHKLEDEKIYQKLFPGEKYEYFKLKNITSDLFGLALEFLKLSLAEQRDIDNEISLLNQLHERKLDNIYTQREKKVKQFLRNAEVKDEDNYLRQYQLERVNIAHYKFEGAVYTFDSIQNEFESFLRYSLTGLLRLYSKMLHNKNHGNVHFDLKMFDNVWEYVKDREFSDNPSVTVYKHIIALELSKNEEDYRKLLEIKEKFRNLIPFEEHYYILLVQNSFAAYMLKLGDESYYEDRFSAFKEMFEYNFLNAEYVIYPNFISAYTSACMANEFEWADLLMLKAQNGISPAEEKLNTIYYCRGFMAYRKKDFGKALQLFSKTKFRFYLMKVMVKSYTARIYYEQNLYEQTLSAADAFRHYLKSEKMMAEDQKAAHFEFLKHLSELTKLRLDGINNTNREELDLLKNRISQMAVNPLGVKNWLIEKAGEL